ncbi:MAG: CocE/NonD family hydrolase, partial [bacterium]
MPPRAPSGNSRGLEDHAPEVAAALSRKLGLDVQFEQSAIVRTTEWVAMRDGVRLATDLYLPPCDTAPAIALRTPYGRRTPQRVNAFTTFARHGYAVMAQDCRGTGESEPDHWNYYVYEREDSVDSVEWVISQPWFSGFVGSIGSSYTGGTQWCMAMHPAMSAITPQVQGLGVAGTSRPRFHMFVNAYSRSVGNGAERGEVGHEALEREMVDETLAGGYFNEPLFDEFSEALVERYPALRSLAPTKARRWLYETYSELAPAQRAQLIRQALGGPNVTISHLEELPRVFGHAVAHDAH